MYKPIKIQKKIFGNFGSITPWPSVWWISKKNSDIRYQLYNHSDDDALKNIAAEAATIR